MSDRSHNFPKNDPRFPSREVAKKNGSETRSYMSKVPQSLAVNSFAHREKRAISAKLCAEERAKRSPAEQLAELDRRLGEGMGAKKERERLSAMLHKNSETVHAESAKGASEPEMKAERPKSKNNKKPKTSK